MWLPSTGALAPSRANDAPATISLYTSSVSNVAGETSSVGLAVVILTDHPNRQAFKVSVAGSMRL
jgi:hypothetical protein